MLKNFKQKLEHYLKVYLIDDLNMYYDFVEAGKANLTGSAMLHLPS